MGGRSNKTSTTKSPSTRGVPFYLCNIFGFHIRFHLQRGKCENKGLTIQTVVGIQVLSQGFAFKRIV